MSAQARGATGGMTRRRALAAAAEWRFLSLLLERPRPDSHREITALRGEVRGVRLQTAADAVLSASEGEYLRLVGPGGAVSPREVAYCGHQDPGWVLSDVASFYQAFAFQPKAEDPIDHIAVEIGFVAYLLLKQAFAQAAGDREAAAVSAEARQRFIQTHLAQLAATFAARLAALGRPYLLAAARVVAARVRKTIPAPILHEPAALGGCGSCTLPT